MTSADRPTRSAPCKKKKRHRLYLPPRHSAAFRLRSQRQRALPSRPSAALLQARQSRAAFGVWASALAAEPRAFSCARYSECWIFFLQLKGFIFREVQFVEIHCEIAATRPRARDTSGSAFTCSPFSVGPNFAFANIGLRRFQGTRFAEFRQLTRLFSQFE